MNKLTLVTNTLLTKAMKIKRNSNIKGVDEKIEDKNKEKIYLETMKTISRLIQDIDGYTSKGDVITSIVENICENRSIPGAIKDMLEKRNPSSLKEVVSITLSYTPQADIVIPTVDWSKIIPEKPLNLKLPEVKTKPTEERENGMLDEPELLQNENDIAKKYILNNDDWKILSQLWDDYTSDSSNSEKENMKNLLVSFIRQLKVRLLKENKISENDGYNLFNTFFDKSDDGVTLKDDILQKIINGEKINDVILPILENITSANSNFKKNLYKVYSSVAAGKFTFSLTKNVDDAKDLRNEGYFRALKFQSKFKPGTNINAWYFTIVKNIFINEYRKKVKRNHVKNADDYIFDTPQSNLLKKPEVYNTIAFKEYMKIVDQLPDSTRIPFLKYYEGLRYQEIADELSLSLGTVKSRIFHARKVLKEKIDKLEDVI